MKKMNCYLKEFGVRIPSGWQQKSVIDVAKVYSGGTPSRNNTEFYGGGIPWIKSGEINQKIIRKTEETISEKGLKVSSAKWVPSGAILVAMYGATAGKVAILEIEATINQAIAAVVPHDNISNIFLFYVLQWIMPNLLRKLQGSGQPNLNSQLIKNAKIPLPLLNEQNRIACILSVFDRAIEKTITLIGSKTKLKKALMQQFLTDKLRFKEFSKIKFHRIELGEFLIPTSRPVPRPNNSYTALGIRSHGKGTFLKTIENPETVTMETLYEVKEDGLIVNITFAWEGAIAIIKKSDEGALVSHRFPTYVFNREIAIPEYFKYVIQTKRFVHELGLVSPGGAGRNRVMSKTDFLNIVVSVPIVNEQKKIAVVLNGIDKEIDLLKKQLECLKTQKKGLMQKLLTGQIRVKA